MAEAKMLHHSSGESYCQNLIIDLQKMAKKSILTDIQLKVGKILIPCHKSVLCAASGYFRGMFSSGFKESSSSQVEIKGCEADALSVLIDYIYLGKVDISTENVLSLIQASDLLELLTVKDACLQYALEHIDAENSIGFKRLGQLLGLKDLVEEAQQCMRKNTKKVVAGPEFLDMAEDELIDYLSDDLLEVESEDALFEALIAWTHVNQQMRVSSFRKLINNIRLEHCTTNFLCNIVQKEPLMKSPEATELVREAMSYQLLVSYGDNASCPNVPPRPKPPMGELVLFTNNSDTFVSSLWVLNEGGTTWQQLSDLPQQSLIKYSACMTPNGILITGGSVKGTVKDGCWLFQMRKQKWECFPSMARARRNHSSALHGDSVLVVGGCDQDDQILNSVQRFNLKTCSWHHFPPLDVAVLSPLVVSCDKDVFVLSGFNGFDLLNRTYRFCNSGSMWEQVADMPWTPRWNVQGACIGDKIFILDQCSPTFMTFQPSTGQWTSLSTIDVNFHGIKFLAQWKQKILITSESHSVFQEYNLEADSWSYSLLELPSNAKEVSYILGVV